MRPRLALALVLALGLGCAKAPASASLTPVVTDSVEDQGATFGVEVGWRSVSPQEVEVIARMTARGIEQTDKLVLDVSTHGFVIADGTTEWTGFIQPRESYRHAVSFKMLDGDESGRVTLTLRRSMDGTMLWETELLFSRDGGSVKLAG
ncbi:MAG: hypothetical protein K0V04_43605 [Deltaproteobacteria bacterium]|nr:hypothetical protein [Deltaproteobacteria bacterium]